MSDAKNDAATLRSLYAQIEEIYGQFKQMRQEAASIASTSQMPDATLHLNDVLHSTETAITTIIDTATAIGSIAQESSMQETDKAKIVDYLSTIYETCSFQDISGQRIKRVLKHLSALEGQLQRLSEMSHGKTVMSTVNDPLLNGPALSAEAPSQAEIDAMFKA